MWTCGYCHPWWQPETHCSDGDLPFTAFDCSTKKSYQHMIFQGSDLMRNDNMVFRANWHWGAEPLHSTSHANKSMNCILLYSEICCGETNTGQLSSNLPFSGDDFILKDCHQVAELRTAARGQQSCKHTISWSKTTKNPLSQDISAHWGKCRDRSCN